MNWKQREDGFIIYYFEFGQFIDRGNICQSLISLTSAAGAQSLWLQKINIEIEMGSKFIGKFNLIFITLPSSLN